MTSDETWISVFPFGLNDQYICCFIRTRGVAYTGGGSCAGCGNRSCRPYRHDLSIPEQHRALLNDFSVSYVDGSAGDQHWLFLRRSRNPRRLCSCRKDTSDRSEEHTSELQSLMRI